MWSIVRDMLSRGDGSLVVSVGLHIAIDNCRLMHRNVCAGQRRKTADCRCGGEKAPASMLVRADEVIE